MTHGRTANFQCKNESLCPIVGGCDWFSEANGVDHGCGGGDIEHLHAGVIKRVKLSEEVEVSRYEHKEEELMCATRDPLRILDNPQS
eukprot:CAMPEP_0198266496 /NCGR_PEP_ID=MMETSP1447-20131203/28585_1 /TAXON_ID=420782 /ORGANISM="Chaetoceros dichaeta, Strain CCMP1751" /LENGTH=86 /DNA_ID=CAMNT_0043956597 /DNA_START=720 /DNA_END=982 /DNA_ORIENTATION=-